MKRIFYILIFALILSFIPTIPVENKLNDSITTIEYKSVAKWAWEMYNAKAM